VQITNLKKFFNELLQRVKNFDFNSFQEDLNSLKIEDIKNINYRRLLYDIRSSKYTKPTIGILSAAGLFVFILIPKIQFINSSFKKIGQYKNESRMLNSQILKLEKESREFKEIKDIMLSINGSFLKNEEIIFIAKLLNETAKKSNVDIKYFSPILKADTSNLCKASTSQKNSKLFKSKGKRTKTSNKGSLQKKYYEVTFSSDYMDLIQFLKEIQMYDVTLASHCLEVESEKRVTSPSTDTQSNDDSLIIPLDQFGKPIISYEDLSISKNSKNSGEINTTIVLQIPSFSK